MIRKLLKQDMKNRFVIQDKIEILFYFLDPEVL